MTRQRHRTWLLSTALVVAFAAQAAAEADPRSLTPEMLPMAEVEAPASELSIEALINRTDGLYMPGETVSMTLRSSEDAWLTVLATDAQGQSTVIFPNNLHRDGFIPANSLLPVPGPGANWQLTVSPPFGANMLTVIAASSEVDPLGGLAVVAAGPFRSIESDASDLARHLAVEMTNKPEAQWSSARIDFAVVESRGEAPANPFELTLSTDRENYRIGEKVSLRLTSERECALTVVNVNEAANEAVILYPNSIVEEIRLPAGETVRLPGADASVELLALGPAGKQTLTARCSADGMQSLPQFAATDTRGVYPVVSLSDWNALTRPASVAEVSVTYNVLQ